LFGDDSILALDEDFDHILSEGYLHRHFAKYGLKLKFLFGGYNYDIEKMQFLGFTFKNIDGIYYPLYDVTKLCTSVLYQNGRNDSREAYTSRLFIITLMSYPDPSTYSILRKAFHNWCCTITNQGDLTPSEQTYIGMNTVSDSTIRQMYTGWESSLSGDLIFLLYNGWKEATKTNVFSSIYSCSK